MYDISVNNMKVSLPCVKISCNFCYVCLFSAKQLCLLMIYMKCGRDLPKLAYEIIHLSGRVDLQVVVQQDILIVTSDFMAS